MNMLREKRNIIVLLIAVMFLINGVQGISYGQNDAPTVTPSETNTSLKVSFIDFLYAYDENAYQVQLRRKTPQGDWITKCEIISLRYGLHNLESKPAGNYVGSVIFTDLEPGTTYQARYRDTNLSECPDNPPSPDRWSAIVEATTHLVTPPRVEFVDANLATAVRRALDLDTGDGVDLLKIPKAELEKLTVLGLRSNVSDLTGLEQATQLKKLESWYSRLTDITLLAQLTQLTELTLQSSRGYEISDISPLTGLTQLTELDLGGNEIIDISPLTQLTYLTELDLSDNYIIDFSPLAGLTKLRSLYLDYNQIQDITPIATLTQLTTLLLRNNQIRDLTPLAQLTRLTLLFLNNNNITDVTPLAQLTNLETLWLDNNNITDVTPLAQLTNLESLRLTENEITDITPLAQLSDQTEISTDSFKYGILPSDIELLTVSSSQPLTAATLNGGSVTLTLLPSGAAYDTSIENIRNALTLTGIDGVTVSDVIRVSDTELNVSFGFTGNLEKNTLLTISLGAEAVTGYKGRALTGEIPVYPDIELTVSTNHPLNAATLNGSVVTLTLKKGSFSTIRNVRYAVRISGVTGITLDRQTDIERVSATEVKITLTFDGSIDEDTILTFTLTASGISYYSGPELTAEIPVSASTELEVTGGLEASTDFPLTKETLDGSDVILTLQNHSYDGDHHDIDVPIIVVSGIPGVKLERFSTGTDFWSLSKTEIYIRLDFSGNLDNDATLTLGVQQSAIKDYNGPPLTTTLPVTVKTGKQVLVPESQRPSIFWINTDTDKIESLDRFDAITNHVASLTVDTAGDKIYWAEHGSSRGTIKRANLDGTNVEVLTTEPVTANSLLVDATDNKLYWIDLTQDKILSANLNGENIRTITQQIGDDILYIAVDAVGDKLYWADQFSIWRVNLDGTNKEKLLTISGFRTYIRGIAVADGKIYWTQQLVWYRARDNIHRANLNGTDIETLATPMGRPTSIVVDTTDSKIYWANSSGGIQRMDINGGDIENVVYGIDAPRGIALGAVSTQPTTPETPTTDAIVRISPASVASPAVGEQLEISLNITDGEAVAGYQASVQFDTTTLRYVSGVNGDFLPAGAFFVQPVVEGNLIKLNAASLAGESSGDGTLATLTFEVIAVKASTLTLTDVLLTDTEGIAYVPSVENAEITESTSLKGDVNGDGIVNIQDLVLVASNLGKTGQNAADVNGDGVVNIQDLVLVAGALGTSAAAPTLNSQSLSTLTAADVKGWLTHAQQLNLTDATSQRGILFLEQLLAALIPKETALLPNFPNPFNPETWIPYHLSKDAEVTLHIYAVNGTLVRKLALGQQAAGIYQSRSRAAYWDGKNEFGEKVASGLYFYTLTAGDYSATRKMLIMK